MKANNVIKFYMLANTLKQKMRRGWEEINIQKDRLESVAEHIYGTLVLAIAIASEYSLDLDMHKVLKMLALHELEEIVIPDYTQNSHITREQKIEEGKIAVARVTEGLLTQKEIEDLLDEFNAHESKESLFCFQIDKLECDFQGKVYDLEGAMDFEAVKNDALGFAEDGRAICDAARNPSDIWIEVDRSKYTDDTFLELLDAIKNYEN